MPMLGRRAWRQIACFSILFPNLYFFTILFPENNKMAVERTLSIIKPDAVAKNVIGKIYSRFETNGLKIIAAAWRTCRAPKPKVSTPCTRAVRSSTIWSNS
jgi:hypothetical protein